MATLRNKQKIAAVLRDTQQSAGNGQSQNKFIPGMTEHYITKVSGEIEVRFTKKLSQEFSRKESRILSALSKLDESLLNPQVQTCFVAVPEISKNIDSENRDHTGDDSLNDPFPEVGFSVPQASNSADSDREETSHSCSYCVFLDFL